MLPCRIEAPGSGRPTANVVLLAAMAGMYAVSLAQPGLRGPAARGGAAGLVLTGWTLRGVLGHIWLHDSAWVLLGNDKCLLLLKNRDNGKVMVYEVGEFDEELHTEVMQIVNITLGFEYGGQHEMPDAKNIMARVSEVELFVQDGEIPDGEPEEYKCDWCNVRYLCERDRTFAVDVTDEALTQAAELWKEADVRVKIAENDKGKAKYVMLDYAKSHEPKFRTAGLSISYNGMRTRKYIDEATLKRLVSKEIVEKARKESAPWEDIQVRRVKANGEEE